MDILIKNLQTKLNKIKSSATYNYNLTYTDIINIENLIKRNLDLEAENKLYKEEINNLNITKAQYHNLRKNWSILIDNILGKDYYNLACDVYTSDDMTCEDILKKKVRFLFKRKDKRQVNKI